MSSLVLDISLDPKDKFSDGKTFAIEYSTSTKFEKDKVNFENDTYYILVDGVILNKAQLLKENPTWSWAAFLIHLYENGGNHFFKQLKGSYYGFIYDKRLEKWIVFTDHISSKPLYFASYGDHICFSHNFVDLTGYLKQKGYPVTLNEQAAYLILTYGYVFEDITLANEIKRMMVGYCAVVTDELQLEKYYSLANKPIEITEKEAIEQIDIRFREAVQLAFEKDLEYGYTHVASLSGGLDSRMTVWVAHDLGYTNQLNLTFSQSDYLDETIPKKIAAHLGHEWLFKALDNGNFLKDIEDTTQITGGNVLYYGLAQGMSLYNHLDFENLGILHTGQVGDVVVSTFYSSLDPHKPFSLGDGSYSRELLPKIEGLQVKEEYPNEELFKMYIRGFYGANQGLKGIMEYSETYSPFYDIDFMEFALSIPLKIRFKNNLYKKWIKTKYPEAAKYIWERENVPVDYKYWVSLKGKEVPLSQLPVKVASVLGFVKRGDSTKNHMQPLEYWYRTNPSLKTFMDAYYKKTIHLLEAWPELKNDCEKLYVNGNGTERVQVLSLLASMFQFVGP